MARAANNALTPKQEQFCLMYFEKGNAAAAYRSIYSADKMVAGSVYAAVNQLLHNSKITTRLAELRAAMRLRTVVTVEDHLVDLERLRDIAVADGEISAAIKAESLRGDALGFYIQKREGGGVGAFAKQRTKDELKASIRARGVRLGTVKVVPITKNAGKTRKAA